MYYTYKLINSIEVDCWIFIYNLTVLKIFYNKPFLN